MYSHELLIIILNFEYGAACRISADVFFEGAWLRIPSFKQWWPMYEIPVHNIVLISHYYWGGEANVIFNGLFVTM